MRCLRPILLLVTVGFVIVACGSAEEPVSEDPPATSSATPTPEASEPSETYPVGRVRDLGWVTPDLAPEVVGVDVQATTGDEWPMALVYPDTDTPDSGWPIVVYFHGSTRGTPLDGLDMLARRGAVVVAPRWAPPEWSETNLEALTAAEYVDGYWFDVAACGLSAAQDAAVAHGGDPNRTTVVGFSAGVHPAVRTTLGTVRNDLCPDRDPAVRPAALVAGDSQWLFQGSIWDETFNDPTSLAADTVDRILNPDRWVEPSDEMLVYLWSTKSQAFARRIDDPPAADSWLTSRPPDVATLLDDLASVDAFADGYIMFDDNALLLQQRLEAVGIRVLHEIFPTDHSYASGVYDRIIEVVFETQFS